MKTIPYLVIALGLIACSDRTPPKAGIDDLVREYLLLELAVGQHDSGHVDAYFGPEEIAANAESSALTLADIAERAAALKADITGHRESYDGADAARIDGLLARIDAMTTRIALNEGAAIAFDDESERLFGARAPDHDAAHFAAILAEISALIPGDAPLAQRVQEFRDNFAIPHDRLTAVFDAAIAECRRRTLQYIDLPANESFVLEYVTDKPWSGYNWYQGNAQSLIQINTDLPILISRAVDLGCHEGYPGHHTFNALLEDKLVRGKGWLEFTLYPLFSPQSLIAEGSGNYGIELAFPGPERVSFERDVLFPLAGLNAAEADQYYQLLALLERLNYAGNEAARDYLNGDIDRGQAADWLVEYGLSGPERAKQRVDFFDTYRSYVINYNLGKDLVRDYVEAETSSPDERWAKFEYLLSNPLLPEDLLD